MKHVKLFEDFNENEGMPNNNGPKTYVYYINNSNEKNFHADVRDNDGKVVFEIKAADFLNDGLMKNKDDLTGLMNLLISKNKIKKGDSIVPANSTSKAVGGQNMEDFVPEVNTNLNQDIYNNRIKTTTQEEGAE